MIDFTDQKTVIKLNVGKYRYTVNVIKKGGRLFLAFEYAPALIAEIKAMRGARWHGYDTPPRKIWSLEDCFRNRFQLAYLMGEDVYAPFDQDLVSFVPKRSLYDHQVEMVKHALTRHTALFACEMGTGKTLAAIEVMEVAKASRGSWDDERDAWYIGPKSGVEAVSRELEKWKSGVRPRMMTYEGLTKVIREWEGESKAPFVVIFDESSKIKNPGAQRSQAAYHLAEAVRSDHQGQGYVILMSGSPAPKSPADWWHQCEVACPGFLREGSIQAFKKRLCLTEQRESMAGGVYPQLITWLDDSKKCGVCGAMRDDAIHQQHAFKPSINEVAKLYRRMEGLVLIQFKKDCLDLPEKRYEIIQVRPTASLLRSAKTIMKTATRAIESLTRLRELSDGFQYIDVITGHDVCPECKGSKFVDAPIPLTAVDVNDPRPTAAIEDTDFVDQRIKCDACGGTGRLPHIERQREDVETPKDQALTDQLELHDDVGRLIVWGGFTGTIDRLTEICLQQCWHVLRIDGRGFHTFDPPNATVSTKSSLLSAMDASHPDFASLRVAFPKVVVVANPEAGGMALTLTAAPTEIFYSNSFKFEARGQAEDRAHRPGMDQNKGLTIIDFVMFPSDKLVIDNLKRKKELQNMSMGELEVAFQDTSILER